ncbi:MAG: CHRD domain-containing protein [Gemmatimonadaceae bacterium]
MKITFVRTLLAAGVIGGAFLASCTGDVGPAGAAGAGGATGPIGAPGPTGATGTEVYRATLTGASEVPPVTSAGTGTATLTLSGGLLLYRVDVGNVTNITAAHIHGPALAGVNAGVRVNLYVPPAGTAPISFTTTATLASGIGSIPNGISQDSLIVLLRNGNTYANVHTSAFPGGELRGQFARVP